MLILSTLRALPAFPHSASPRAIPEHAHWSKKVRILDIIIPQPTRGRDQFGSTEQDKRKEALWEKRFFHSRGLSYGLAMIPVWPTRNESLQPETQTGCKRIRTSTDHKQAGPWCTWARSHAHLPSIAPGAEVIGRETAVHWGLKATVKSRCRTREREGKREKQRWNKYEKTRTFKINFTSVRISRDGRADSLGLLLNSYPLQNIFAVLVASYARIFWRDP